MNKKILALACGLAVMGAAHAQTATEAELAKKLDQLAAELAAVKAQLAEMQQKQKAAAAAAPAAPTAAGAAVAAPAATAQAYAAPPPAAPATVISGYGEANYNRPTKASEDAQADLRRFVIGLQHRFDDQRTKMVGELEIEHAISSADDEGEVEIEQAYIEHQITPVWGARAGLFLMPVGLLNENHEPTAYYGVERNFVETAIIPTTWREGGVQAFGNFDNGLTLQAGASTGFDLTKWDAASPEGAESPLGAVHQELQLAKARDISVFGALNWRGIPGLLLGGSLFTGGATHQQSGFADARVTLWDAHARWTPGRWDLSALYSRGSISKTAQLNATLVGNPTLIPKRFDGWYAQAAYKLWTHDDYALSPFVRWEQFNTGRRYANLGAGLTPASRPTEKVLTLGANFQLTPGVVLKADYQRFEEVSDNNRFDLGLGWSF